MPEFPCTQKELKKPKLEELTPLQKKLSPPSSEKEIKRWSKWNEKAPLASLLYGITIFPIVGYIASFIPRSSPIGIGWGFATGFLWGVIMMVFDQRRMEKFNRLKSEQGGAPSSSPRL